MSIKIRPRSLDRTTKKLTSEPLSQLRMNGKPGDPDWAPYAVIMYSAFYDFSNRLIESFGLHAPSSPSEFTFNEAVGTETELGQGQ